MGRRVFIHDNVVDVAAVKVEEMQQVADIIRMAQRAERKELLAVKAGLDAAFGDAWRQFQSSPEPPLSEKL